MVGSQVAAANPKSGASAVRYAAYATATTAAEFLALGGSRGDLQNDLFKGMVELLSDGGDVLDWKSHAFVVEAVEYNRRLSRGPLSLTRVSPRCYPLSYSSSLEKAKHHAQVAKNAQSAESAESAESAHPAEPADQRASRRDRARARNKEAPALSDDDDDDDDEQTAL